MGQTWSAKWQVIVVVGLTASDDRNHKINNIIYIN